MADLADVAVAARVVADPGAAPADLAAIAQAHPALRAQVAQHPNVYPGLLAWLDGLGDPALSRVVAQRQAGFSRASDPITFVSAPLLPPPPSPAAAEGQESNQAQERSSVRVPAWIAVLAMVVAVGLIVVVAYLLLRPSPGGGTATPSLTHPGPMASSTVSAPTTPASTSAMPTTTAPSPSPVPVKPWVGTYGGSGRDEFSALAVDADGSVVAVGTTGSRDGQFPARPGAVDNGSGNRDALVARIAPDGTLIWATVLGSTIPDQFYDVAIAPDGTIVAVGQTCWQDGDTVGTPAASPSSDFAGAGDACEAVAAALEPDGTVRWAKAYGGQASALAALTITAQGEIVAVGHTYGGGDFGTVEGGVLAWLSDRDGSVQRAHVIPTRAYYAVKVLDGDTGSLVVGGESYEGGCHGEGCGPGTGIVAAFDAAGIAQWEVRQAPDDKTSLRGLLDVTPSGLILVAGSRPVESGDLEDGILMAYNDRGAVVWSRSVGDTPLALGAVAALPDGTLAATAWRTGPSGYTYTVLRLAADGTLQGVSDLVGPAAEDGYSDAYFTDIAVTGTTSPGIVVAGTTGRADGPFAATHGDRDALVAFLNADGTLG